MFKTQILIEIPDGYELAENEMRTPRVGELYLMPNGRCNKSSINLENDKYPILKKKWQWPSWLKAYCIAMDKSGKWYGYRSDPYTSSEIWRNQDNSPCLILDPELVDIELPTCTDWTKSKIINPNITKQ